jgi:hypothetical protein
MNIATVWGYQLNGRTHRYAPTFCRIDSAIAWCFQAILPIAFQLLAIKRRGKYGEVKMCQNQKSQTKI